MFTKQNYKILITLFLIMIFSFSSIGEPIDEVPRVLLVGDSWTGFMWAFRTFKEIFLETPGLEKIREIGSRTAIMGARAFEFYPESYNYIQNIKEELEKYPTIDIVVMTLGGNDFLRGTPQTPRWNCSMLSNPDQEAYVINTIVNYISGIIDEILSVRPDIRVALCGYTFGGRDRGGCSICDQQGAFVRFEQAKKALADSKPRVYYVHNLGLMQYHFGTSTPTNLPPHSVPYPGGYPSYTPFPGGDPCSLVHPSALFDGDIHLSQAGYKILAQRCMSEFINQWLDYPKVYRINQISAVGSTAVYEVVFSETVSGVDISDFVAKDSQNNTLPITSINAIDGKTYRLNINIQGAVGNIIVGLVDNDSITDISGKQLGGPGTGNNEGNGDFWFNGIWEYQDFIRYPDYEIEAGMWYLHENLSAYYVLLGEQGAEGLSFNPTECDLNGGQLSIEPIVISGNGMLDALEFALITECYKNPNIDFTSRGGVSHQIAVNAFNHNMQRMIYDCGGENGIVYTIFYGLPQMLAGYMTLGNQESTMIPTAISVAAQAIDPSFNIRVNIIIPLYYQSLPQYFGPNGDADGDGWSNKQEYLYFVKNGTSYEEKKSAYISSALNPDVYPGYDCEECTTTNTRGGIFEVGTDICLRVPDPVAQNSMFKWSKMGEDLEARGLTTHCRSLWIHNAQIEDSGIYRCEYDDGQKTSAIYTVRVTVVEELPIGNTALYITLIGTISILAGIYLRKVGKYS
ncbi:MAG: hypothetical protein N3G21_12700 [Candidatus Hydrogenedentes bacterium]|nr:hypothetical protein [Candidatus Hydrogenedentota bacterium]